MAGGFLRFLGHVLQEAGDARSLEQQRLVVLHQQTLVTGHVLLVQDQLGALRTGQQDGLPPDAHGSVKMNLRISSILVK